MDDAELVRQVLQGNIGAYGELLNRYVRRITALCRAHVPRPDVVEDLVQETMLRGLDRLADLRQPAAFSPWLHAIARNLCLTWHNDPDNGHVPLDAATPVPAADDATVAPDRVGALRQCVRHLPVDLREVIELYYSGGRVTYQDIADSLGMSFGRVNQLLTRARKLLRVCLERATEAESPP